MALSTTPGGIGGSQATTQNPQTATGGGSSAAGNLQPGVAGSELASVNGVPVQNPSLPVIPLGSANDQATTSTASSTLVTTTHHPQPVLLGVSLGLLVVAAILFWTTGRSGKNKKYL
jgi:hypothetical protein